MTGVYGARSVKRTRATRSEMEHRHARLHELVAEGQPMTLPTTPAKLAEAAERELFERMAHREVVG